MRFIYYLFWKFWIYFDKKNNDKDISYFFVTTIFGLFFIFFPLISHFITYINLTDKKYIDILLTIPLIIVCSLPIRLVFPKKKIFEIKFEINEKNKFNKIILLMLLLLIFIFLIMIKK